MMGAVEGNILKMKATYCVPIEYRLSFDTQSILLNDFLDKPITLSFDGRINCIACSRKIKKSYAQGYCYPCSQALARCDMCILKPHLCHFHLGTCREPQWGRDHCMVAHWIYLANSSGVKVGLTRHSQVPTRWIDQGAVQALGVLMTQNRRIAGILEAELSKYVADKTNWRVMLKGNNPSLDLIQLRDELLSKAKIDLQTVQQQFGFQSFQHLNHQKVKEITYPVIEYPQKVTSLSFEKTPVIKGVLKGIKGQYLILDSGVLNIRKHNGYYLKFNDA